MAQVTIYLNDDLVARMSALAHAKKLSKSAWIAEAIAEKLADEWPAGVRELAGAWDDDPDGDSGNVEHGTAQDVPRERL